MPVLHTVEPVDGVQRMVRPAGVTPAELKPTRSKDDPVPCWMPTVAPLPVARSPWPSIWL